MRMVSDDRIVPQDGTLGQRACSMCHIRPQVMSAGSVIKVQAKSVRLKSEAKTGKSNKRGVIAGGWSTRSRNRLVMTLEACDWGVLGMLAWITLTYPSVWPDGQEVKRHLNMFKRRWRRQFGCLNGAWKLEFQRRGAPHFHLLLEVPDGWTIEELREWIGSAWCEVVASGDSRHLHSGTSCDWWTGGAPVIYFACYGRKVTKEYQNKAPEGYWTGRWWGLWGIKPQWEVVDVPVADYVRVRRALAGLSRSRTRRRGRKIRLSGLRGMWVRCESDTMEKLLDIASVRIRQ